jgi:hypothetical protein
VGDQTTEKQFTRAARGAVAALLQLEGIILRFQPPGAPRPGAGFQQWRQDQTQNHNVIGMILFALSMFATNPALALEVALLAFDDQVRFGHCSCPLRKDECMSRSHWAWNAVHASLSLLAGLLVRNPDLIARAVAWWRCEQAINLAHRIHDQHAHGGLPHVACAGGRDPLPGPGGKPVIPGVQTYHRDLATAWLSGENPHVPDTANPDDAKSGPESGLDMTFLWALILCNRLQEKRGEGPNWVQRAVSRAGQADMLPFRNRYHLQIVPGGFLGWWETCDGMERPSPWVIVDERTAGERYGTDPRWSEQEHVVPSQFPPRPTLPVMFHELPGYTVARGAAA